MKCKYICLGYPVIVCQLMLKQKVLLYPSTNFHTLIFSLTSTVNANLNISDVSGDTVLKAN